MTRSQSVPSRHRIAVVVAGALALVAFVAAPASAMSGRAQDGGGDGGGDGNSDITLLTSTLPSMHPGATAWVSTLWKGAKTDAHNFKLTATSSGATIGYPANTASYSSLWGSSDLLSAATDFAALKVTIGAGVTSTVKLSLHVTYDLDKNNDKKGETKSKSQDLQVSIPISVVSGASITAVTTSFGPVSAGSTTWLQFSVRGEKPGVTALTAQVTAPAGITISYPNDAASSSPNTGSTLDVGTTDYLAFKATVGALAAGSYNLTVTLSFGSGQTQSAVVPLVVS